MAGYLALVLLIYPLYRFRINPDGTAYLSLARKWAQGDWYGGVAGHWAPLLPWLLAISKKAGLGDAMAVTAVNAGISIAILLGFERWDGNSAGTGFGDPL